MCGLAGIAGPGINIWDIDVLRDLAYVSGLRGRDSTGILQGRSNPNYFGKVNNSFIIEKSNVDVGFFQEFHRTSPDGNKDLFSGVQNNFFAVHTRHATKGEVTKENSHPFEFNKLIGMHNGTLLDKRYHQDGKTDSELLLKDMDENGIVPTLKKLNPSSAYAMVIYEKDTGDLIFTRNDHRPLYLCYSKSRAVMYWASESWMLRSIMARQRELILNEEVSYFKTNRIYRVNPHDIKAGTNKQFDIEEFAPKPLVENSGYLRNVPRITYGPHSVISPEERKQEVRQERQRRERIDWRAKKKEEKQKKDHLSVLERNKNRVTFSKEGNVIASIFPENQINKNENLAPKNDLIPAFYCCACHGKMSLVDQYFATKLSSNTFLHKECETSLPMN